MSIKFVILLFLNFNLLLAQIPVDKQLHFIAGVGISTISCFTTYHLTKNKKLSLWIGLSSGILAGMGKEFRDGYGYGVPSVNDALASGIGAVASSLTMKILINRREPKIRSDLFGHQGRKRKN